MSRWFVALALLGLTASFASSWVHYRVLHDPTYVSACDVNATFSCSEAYTSQYGAVAGVPVAVLGVVFFVFVLLLVALCSGSKTASANLPGYIFAASTIGLAVVLYLGYASFFILKAVCLLCVGSYVAVIGLFLTSGAATRYHMTSLPGRASRDLGALARTPAAVVAVVAFVAAAGAAVWMFPSQPVSATASATSPADPAQAAQAATQLAQFEDYLSQQPRVPVVVATDGAAVVVVKFNDYQCPPCRQTYMEYSPIFAKWAKEAPGKVKLVTKDFALEPECNVTMKGAGVHVAACEAAVAVRLAGEKGKAEAMEQWLFANQPTLTPESVRQAAKDVGGVTDMDARYAKTIELVKADTAQGGALGVNSTPTFFLNGMKLPGLRPEFFDAAIAWELKRVGGGK